MYGIPSVCLIGIGGIGTPLVPLLDRVKPERVTVWDDDIVSTGNLVNQTLWSAADVGKSKAAQAGEYLGTRGGNVRVLSTRYEGTTLFDTVVIAAVDSLQSRRQIWSGVTRKESRTEILFDGRLSREHPHFFQLFAIPLSDAEACTAYISWLEDGGEVDTGRRDIDMVPAPFVLCGIIGTLLIRWSRGESLPWQVVWDGVGMTLMSFETEKRS